MTQQTYHFTIHHFNVEYLITYLKCHHNMVGLREASGDSASAKNVMQNINNLNISENSSMEPIWLHKLM